MTEKVQAQNAEFPGECNNMLMFLTTVFGFLLYLQVIQKRQHVAVLEGCLAGSYLILLIFPNAALSYVVSNKDEQPLSLFLLVLICLLSQTLTFQLTRNSSQPEVVASMSIVNILTRSSLVSCALYGSMFVQPVSNFAAMIIFVLFIPLILGDLIQLFRISSKPYLTVGDPISWHLSADAILTFFLASLLLAFPEVFCGKMRGGDMLLVKILGSVSFGSSVLSFAGLCFRNDDDALAILKSKLIMNILYVVISAISFQTDEMFWTNGHPILLILYSGVLLYNAGTAIGESTKSQFE